jgi:hypothetical protein
MRQRHIQQVECKGNKKTPYDSAKHEEGQIIYNVNCSVYHLFNALFYIQVIHIRFKKPPLDMEIVRIYTQSTV